jgi:hypothetical protein
MPAPSLTKSSDINTELGKGSTTILRLGDANTRNLATKSSGAISFGNCRWGINFPGGDFTLGSFGGGIYVQTYDFNDSLSISASDIKTTYDSFSSAQAATAIRLFANGTLRLEVGSSSYATAFHHKLWLTSGVNSNYTAQFQVTSGALTSGDSSNTDLVLSSDRAWFVTTSTLLGTGGDQSETLTASGNLIIKDSGGTLITRPISLVSVAVLGSL